MRFQVFPAALPRPRCGAGRAILALVPCLAACLLLEAPALSAEDPGYLEPAPDVEKLQASAWTLHAFERERTANGLAAYVVNVLWPSDAADKARWTARFLGLAMALHRENPRASLTHWRLRSGQALPPMEAEFSPEIFARILYHRAVQLREGKAPDQRLARYFMAVAAYIDPYFDDAVYAHEVDRFDGNAPDWSLVTGRADAAGTRGRGGGRP